MARSPGRSFFSRNFPNYSVGLQLSIPLRNRNAQANYATAAVNLHQNELSVQRLINQIHVDVQNALITVGQARAQYSAAVKSRILQEQTLDAEQKKYAVGASTPSSSFRHSAISPTPAERKSWRRPLTSRPACN